MRNNDSVCAVIVTYNRKNYLIKTLDALSGQTHKLSAVFVLDNFGTDGTPDMLVEAGYIDSYECGTCTEGKLGDIPFFFYRNSVNSGGSGGFHKAMGIASDMGFDYLWIMDDDVMPENTCLETLLAYTSDDVRVCVPNRTDENYLDYANTHYDLSNVFRYRISMMKKRYAATEISGDCIEVCDMPFEGPLIAVSVIKEIGLPQKDLFILYDDTEYATRATAVTRILFVKSAILHRQIVVPLTKNKLMGWKDYYAYRNQFWFDRTYGKNMLVRKVRPLICAVDLMCRATVLRKWSNYKVIRLAYRHAVTGVLGKTVEPGKPVEEW